jgi:hypothetical protein
MAKVLCRVPEGRGFSPAPSQTLNSSSAWQSSVVHVSIIGKYILSKHFAGIDVATRQGYVLIRDMKSAIRYLATFPRPWGKRE